MPSLRWFLFSFLLSSVSILQGEYGWQLEERNLIVVAQNKNLPIIAIILGEDCPWSKKLSQEILDSAYFLEKMQAEVILWVSLLKQDTEAKAFLQKYQVEKWPLFLFLDPQGKEFARLEYIPLNAHEYVETMLGMIEDFHEICIALNRENREWDEQEWQRLYQKTKGLSVPCFQHRFLERGLQREKGVYFHFEKFVALFEKHNNKHPQVRKAKEKLLRRDPHNRWGTHFQVALLEFQKMAAKPKLRNRPKKALTPLLRYLRQFGKKDFENYWKCEWKIAEFLYQSKCILPALEHAKAAFDSCPEAIKPEIADRIFAMQQALYQTRK